MTKLIGEMDRCRDKGERGDGWMGTCGVMRMDSCNVSYTGLVKDSRARVMGSSMRKNLTNMRTVSIGTKPGGCNFKTSDLAGFCETSTLHCKAETRFGTIGAAIHFNTEAREKTTK